MTAETWKPGDPRAAQLFRLRTANELNVTHGLDDLDDFPECALPVDGDKTAILRGRTRW